ncbi:hypothetical protein HLK59_11240 [Streptomyces sp. S3(2020)]|uniref:hypothetical protein n=1 Tax=Streptomyces sp. S3(2020) TaxID=2732044 RepID=UPI0014893AFA|nr:hypothetical protein [Streptomyces sp. S3(2020)]NNN30934.1 hypothetical protein [Streptomyces sp. S3(2020)]
MPRDTRDLNWNSLLQFDQEMIISGLRTDADAARLRENEEERALYLKKAEQLDMLPRLWELGVRLTVDEYTDALRVRRWIQHEQQIATHERWVARRVARGLPAQVTQWNADEVAKLRAKIRFYWSADGHLLFVILGDDGALTVNSEYLTPEWVEQLRRAMPSFTELLTRYADNQASGLGHAGLALDSTPLPGPTLPEPVRLWCERMEEQLRRRGAEQARTGSGA